MIVIGFVGRCRSGKTTAANAMQSFAGWRGIKARQYDFGKMVLDFCIAAGRIPDKKREALNSAELHTLVYVGKQQREKDPDFWVKKIEENMISESPELALIPNVRFHTEVELVKKYRGKLVRVSKLNPNGTEHISIDRDPNDTSEVALAHYPADYYILAVAGQDTLVRDFSDVIIRRIIKDFA